VLLLLECELPAWSKKSYIATSFNHKSLLEVTTILHYSAISEEIATVGTVPLEKREGI